MASRETHDFSVLPSAWKDGSMIIDGTANDFSFNTVFFLVLLISYGTEDGLDPCWPWTIHRFAKKMKPLVRNAHKVT